MFDVIEKHSEKDIKKIYEGAGAYISLIRDNGGKVFEYWIGMFMPKGTIIPIEYEMIAFPKSTLNVCRVYGKKDCIINREPECRKKLAEEGIEFNRGEGWFFQRFDWRDFFKEDKFGKRIIEYCYYR